LRYGWLHTGGYRSNPFTIIGILRKEAAPYQTNLDTVDGSEIRRSPVEVGKYPMIYRIFTHIPGSWLCDFWLPSTVWFFVGGIDWEASFFVMW